MLTPEDQRDLERYQRETLDALDRLAYARRQIVARKRGKWYRSPYLWLLAFLIYMALAAAYCLSH